MSPDLLKPILDLVTPAGAELAKAAITRRGQTKDVVISSLHEKFAQIIRDADPAALAHRVRERQEYSALRKQLNYENVIELALDLALETPAEQLRSVEPNWFAQWFSAVEDVSDPVMQELWARAFAQQTTTEKRSVSLRALDSLRLMERGDVFGFQRAVELFSYFGYIFGASQEIIDAMMPRDTLNSLMDLNLIEHEESMIRSVALPGGYLLRLRTEEGTFAPDPVHVFRLSPRGVELAPTIPPSLEKRSPLAHEFDIADNLCVARYLNMIAQSLSSKFSVTLCVYEPFQGRPPKGGIKRTHIWDQDSHKWIRKERLDFDYDEAVVSMLEAKNHG